MIKGNLKNIKLMVYWNISKNRRSPILERPLFTSLIWAATKKLKLIKNSIIDI